MVQTKTSQVIFSSRSCQTFSDSSCHQKPSMRISTKSSHQLTNSITSPNHSAKNQLQSNIELMKTDMDETLNTSRPLTFENNVTTNTAVFTSTESRANENKENSATIQQDIESSSYAEASNFSSPKLFHSFHHSRVSSLTTPLKDRRQCNEEFTSPKRKSPTLRKFIEYSHPKQINSNDTEEIKNSDAVFQNNLNRAEKDSLFNAIPFHNNKDCDDLKIQESAIESTEGVFLTAEDAQTNENKNMQATIVETMILEPETDSSEQCNNIEEKNNKQNFFNETALQLLASSQVVSLSNKSDINHNTPTDINIETPEPVQVDKVNTDLMQESDSKDAFDSYMSIIQQATENQVGSCSNEQNKDAANGVKDVQFTVSSINESSTSVSTSATELGANSILKPVPIGTPFQVETQIIVPQAACSINQSIPMIQKSSCCPSSSLMNREMPLIPSNKNNPIQPTVQNQNCIVNSNFQTSPVLQFSYPAASGFPMQSLNGFQSKIIVIQQPCCTRSMNIRNWTNDNLTNNIILPIQPVSAKNVTQSTIMNSSLTKKSHNSDPSKSFLATNVINFGKITSETIKAPKKTKKASTIQAKDLLGKRRRQKNSKQKSSIGFKQKTSGQSSFCSRSNSTENTDVEKKIEKTVDEGMSYLINSSSRKGSGSNKVKWKRLNRIQKETSEESEKMEKVMQSHDLSEMTGYSSCNPIVLESDEDIVMSEIDNKNVTSQLMVTTKNKSSKKKQKKKFKDKLCKKLTSSSKEIILNIKKSRRKKSSISHCLYEMIGNSSCNPIILKSDEDMETSEMVNENVTSQVILTAESDLSKKEQKKKLRDDKCCTKLNKSSKETILNRKKSMEKILSISLTENSSKSGEISDHLSQNTECSSLTGKSNYKTTKEHYNKEQEKQKSSNKKSKTENLNTIKEKTSINETNNQLLLNEINCSPSENGCITSPKMKQISENKSMSYISAHLKEKETCHPNSPKKSQYLLRTVNKSRNIDKICDKLKLSAIQYSSSKEKSLKKDDQTINKLPNSVVTASYYADSAIKHQTVATRNSIEVSNDDTPFDHELFSSEIVVPVNPTESEVLKSASIEIENEEKSTVSSELRNNIAFISEAAVNSKQSSGDYKLLKPSIKKRVLHPPKKRTTPFPIQSPCDEVFSPSFSSTNATSTLNPNEMPLSRNPSHTEINKLVTCPPKLHSPEHTISVDLSTEFREMPSSPINIDTIRKCHTLKSNKSDLLLSPDPILDSLCTVDTLLDKNIPLSDTCKAFLDKKKNLGNKIFSEMNKAENVSQQRKFPLSLIKDSSEEDGFRKFLPRIEAIQENISAHKRASENAALFPSSQKHLKNANLLSGKENFLKFPRKNFTCKQKPSQASCQLQNKLNLTTNFNPHCEIFINKVSDQMKSCETNNTSSFHSKSVEHLQRKKKSPINCSALLTKVKSKSNLKRSANIPLIPAGVKIPNKWSKSKIKNYSDMISMSEDEKGSKVTKSKPTTKVTKFKSSLNINSASKRKTEFPFDLSIKPDL
ncbi:uncharacterized protein LOC129984775 isoform X2 [Argiope bruennichi]|nr:uncharacterized protein LOC129984775 isoform X2 [Argiope bruennichi]